MQAESYIVRRLYFVKQKQLNDSSHRVSIFAAALHAAHEAYLNDKHVNISFSRSRPTSRLRKVRLESLHTIAEKS